MRGGPERAAAGCDRRPRERLRRGRRRDGQDDGARRAVRPGGGRRRPGRRLAARDHVHGAGCGRAARADSLGADRAGRPDLALELDGAWVSTIHGFCRRLLGAYPLVAGVDPCASASTSRRRSSCRRRRSRRRSNGSAPWTRPSAGSSSRPTARSDCAGCSSRSTRRSVGGARAGTGARDAGVAGAIVSALRDAASSLLADAGATDAQHDAASAALELLEASTLPERLLALADLKPRGPRAATFVEARDRVVAAARWKTSRPAIVNSSRSS